MKMTFTILLTICLTVCFLILDCKREEKAGAESVGWAMSDADRKVFDPLIKKHGLRHHLAVIYDWPVAPYFIDQQGRRIKFK